jgi:hypothetical protein
MGELMGRPDSVRRRSLKRMAANGLSVVREPWALLVSAFGGGVAWAVQLPFPAVAAVGVGMLGAAGVARALTTEGSDYVGAAPLPELAGGTPQADLVRRLIKVANQLNRMIPTFAGTTLGGSVVEAATGASSAVESAQRLAGAVDGIDEALAGMRGDYHSALSAQARESAQERQAVIGRLHERRSRLLARLEAAYLGAEEVRVRLLEVSATLQSPDVDPAADSGLAQVSAELDHLRRGVEELESTAARELPRPPSA